MPENAEFLRSLIKSAGQSAAERQTPPNWVFDDEPIEAVLYGTASPGPSPANIFAPAREALELIREAIKKRVPHEALLIAESLLRAGQDMPPEMWEELRPLWCALTDSAASPFLVGAGVPAVDTGSMGTQHLAFLVDLAFDCFVHGDSERCLRVWRIVSDVNATVADPEDALSNIVPDIACWWQGNFPGSFPGTARTLQDFGMDTHVVATGQPPALSFNTVTMGGIRSLVKRYSAAQGQNQLRRFRHLTVAAATTSEAAGGMHLCFATCLNLLVRTLQDEGEHGAAIELGRLALAIREQTLGAGDPTLAQSLNNLGLSLVNCQAYAEAEAMLQRATRIRPDFPNPHYWLARLYGDRAEQGDREKEATSWHSYIDLGPTTPARALERLEILESLQLSLGGDETEVHDSANFQPPKKQRPMKFLGLRIGAWVLLAIPSALAAVFVSAPGDLPVPKDTANIFDPMLVTTINEAYRIVSKQEAQKLSSVFALTTVILSDQKVTREFGTNWQRGACLGFYHRSATWKYSLTATHFGDWKGPANAPLEIDHKEIAKILPIVVEELNRHGFGRGNLLKDVLDNGRHVDTVVCWQNVVVLLAWCVGLLTILAIASLLFTTRSGVRIINKAE
ncbi:MAG: tetratricopeptide repeat protein [Verrucomicrobiales bacterium]